MMQERMQFRLEVAGPVRMRWPDLPAALHASCMPHGVSTAACDAACEAACELQRRTLAAARLRTPKARTTGSGMRSLGPPILKFRRDRCVWAPQYLRTWCWCRCWAMGGSKPRLWAHGGGGGGRSKSITGWLLLLPTLRHTCRPAPPAIPSCPSQRGILCWSTNDAILVVAERTEGCGP
jgi:hypothetical protein